MKPRESTHQVAGSSGDVYTITLNGPEGDRCGCKAFEYSTASPPTCKHIKLLRNLTEGKDPVIIDESTPIRSKCDGNHAGAVCADPECWLRDAAAEDADREMGIDQSYKN